MELTSNLINIGFSLRDITVDDLDDFIHIEKVSHNKYVVEHKDFFGEWNTAILINSFHSKRKMTFFKKLLWNNEVVGFLGYNQKFDIIDNVFIRLIEKAQNKGIGTLFLTNLKQLSRDFCIPVLLVVIKTNPAQNLYKKLGFELYKEQDVFYFFRYPNTLAE